MDKLRNEFKQIFGIYVLTNAVSVLKKPTVSLLKSFIQYSALPEGFEKLNPSLFREKKVDSLQNQWRCPLTKLSAHQQSFLPEREAQVEQTV